MPDTGLTSPHLAVEGKPVKLQQKRQIPLVVLITELI